MKFIDKLKVNVNYINNKLQQQKMVVNKHFYK